MLAHTFWSFWYSESCVSMKNRYWTLPASPRCLSWQTTLYIHTQLYLIYINCTGDCIYAMQYHDVWAVSISGSILSEIAYLFAAFHAHTGFMMLLSPVLCFMSKIVRKLHFILHLWLVVMWMHCLELCKKIHCTLYNDNKGIEYPCEKEVSFHFILACSLQMEGNV